MQTEGTFWDIHPADRNRKVHLNSTPYVPYPILWGETLIIADIIQYGRTTPVFHLKA